MTTKKMTKAEKKKRAAARKKAAAQSTGPKPPDVTPYPEAGTKVTAFEEKLDAQIGPDDKPRRGRPPKPKSPEPEESEVKSVSNEIVRQAVQVPFDLWAISQKLKGLKLDDGEVAMLAEPVKTLLDYYLPQLPMIAIAWASLTICTYAVMKPRLELIAETKKQRKSAGRDTGPDAPIQSGSPQPARQRANIEFPSQVKTQKL